MHVVGPLSAAGSAFNTIGTIPSSARCKKCPCWERGGEAVFPGAALSFTSSSRGASGTIVTTGMMKPLVGGSIRRAAVSDYYAPTPGCQPRQRRKSKMTNNVATDCSIDRFESIGWAPWAAGSYRQTSFHGSTRCQRVTSARRQVQRQPIGHLFFRSRLALRWIAAPRLSGACRGSAPGPAAS